MSYILPQVQVFQEFRVLPQAVVENLNAFVFGPNYQLFRYAVDAEKALIGLGAYDKDNDTDYSYPSQPAESTVDLEYVKLYMDNVWAEYLQIPAADANPLNVVSAAERNKLRAAPVIGEAKEGAGTDSVTMDSAGWFVGGVDLPEDYYFIPYGGWTGSEWEDSGYESDLTTQDGRFRYVTSEALSGNVEILATNNPLQAGVLTEGPDGLQLDLDSGTDDTIRAPLIATVASATQSFTLTIDWTQIKTLVNWDIDDATPLDVKIDLAAGSNSVVWDDVNRELRINSDGSYDIKDLYDDLAADSDVATYFDLGTQPAGAEAVTGVTDDSGASMATAAAISMVPDCYRIRMTPNPYVFKTGNGYAHSAHFKSRGVVVGDRLRYQVTVGAQTFMGETRIVGFEADQSLASVADPSAKETNAADQTGTNLASGADIVVAGSDNQRDMDGLNTKVHALDAVYQKYTGELVNGVVADTYIVEITVPGVKGTAEATVRNAAGTYYRENVPIEDAGADDGQLYIGRNLYINFDKGSGDADAEFQFADTYTFNTDIEAPFSAVDTAVMESGGVYEGPSDTTYIAEVVRGGAFDRTVNAIDGLQVTSGATLNLSINWDDWTGGDIDDEYILRCVSAGSITAAEFELLSLTGDDQLSVQFPGTGASNDITLGGRGLTAYITESGGPLSYAVGEYWVIKLNAARPQIKISDSAGIDQGSYEVVNDTVAVSLGGYGATLAFSANNNTEAGFVTNGGLLKGDVFYIVASAASDAAIKTLVLADDFPEEVVTGYAADGSTNGEPDNVGVWFYLVQASAEIDPKNQQSPPDYNWEATADEISVNQDIAVQDATWTEGDGSMPFLSVYKGDLYVEYRALLPTYSDTIHSISDIGDVETTLGTITPDNPLAQGVYNALSNSGDRAVYYMAVVSDDHSGYLGVLDKASLSDDIYGFAPLSRDLQVLNSVEAHINDMSGEENKRWRIAFVGTDMATERAIYNLASNPASEEFYALVEDDPVVAGSQYTLVQFVDDAGDPSPYTMVLDDVVVGDKVRINFSTDPWGDATYEEYTVAELVSNTALKLETGPSVPITIPTKVEVWHDYSVAEMATAVAAVSAGFANRRIYHVFPDQLGAYGVQQTSEFAAAAIAGLCSSVPPQQGLTNIAVNGFDDLPLVYSTFNREQLNEMAEGGTLIIMQDIAGGEVYVRHQVSTATSGGNLNTTELSVTKNLDSISYYFAARLSPFIGRYNVTPELLEVLNTQIADGLMYLGSFTNVGLLGPQVILAGTEIVRVEQHPTLQDHVLAEVNVQLPYPLNVLQLYLVV